MFPDLHGPSPGTRGWRRGPGNGGLADVIAPERLLGRPSWYIAFGSSTVRSFTRWGWAWQR